MPLRSVTLVCLGVLISGGAAFGQMPANYDFNFATVGAVGNSPWMGEDNFMVVHGRGRVDYEYRISKLEVTTAQWMEFVNTYSTQGGDWTFFGMPIGWGAVRDRSYTGPGRRYKLEATAGAAMFPVDGISWRDAARYCNWLHNGKAAAPDALMSGAYDVSTFSTSSDGTFTDQLTRSPGARYWIPSLDEWIKAAHYDPNRYGAGQGGYWEYTNMSDQPGTPGLPGIGTTSAGLSLPDWGEFDIPLGAYSEQMSPWGLWDTSGGASEYLEEALWPGFVNQRILDGSYAGGGGWQNSDWIGGFGSTSPGNGVGGAGLRIASAVPSPLSIAILVGGLLSTSRRRRIAASFEGITK